MSDTDEELEIIPDSQAVDSSMISVSGIPSVIVRTSSGKRRRIDADIPEEDDENTASQMSAIERGTMDEHLSCGICLSILENPFMVLPCMHSYDRECLAEWWRSNTNCPVCKQRSTAARYNFHLANIIHQYRKDTKRTSQCRPEECSREDLYPRGRRPPRSLPSSYVASQTQSQSQFDSMLLIPGSIDDIILNSQSQSQNVLAPIPDRDDPFPGGNLIFPCPSCLPGNNTGYICPDPIQMPTDAQIAAEQAAYRPGGTPLRPPGRGEPHVPLQAALLNSLPGATTHNQCRGCSAYIPAGWEPAKQRCGECGIISCSNYDPLGCPEGRELRPRNALAGDEINARVLWDSCPASLRINMVEFRKFQGHLANHNITIDNVLESFAEHERQIEADSDGNLDDGEDNENIVQRREEANNRWGPGVYLCGEALAHLIHGRGNFYLWWSEERRRVDTSSLPDCWYGVDCRTQTREDHAMRYNHICPNTYAARSRNLG